MQIVRKAMAARVAATARPTSELPTKDEASPDTPSSAPSQASTGAENPSQALAAPSVAVSESMASHPRQAWEHVDEILQTLKTTFPLLILSLETMVDQIQHKFKPSPEEDVYRHVSLLLSDAVQVCV